MAAKTTDWRPGPTVCRCCLSEGCYKDISTEYFWMGKREVYAEMLSETLNLSIAYSTSGGPNSNSRLICEPCISRLRDASDFKRQVQECEKTFMQYLDPGSEPLSDYDEARVEVPVERLETQVKVEPVKTEKDDASDGDGFDDRAEFLDDDDDDLDDQPLTRLATKVPKKESVDLLELLGDTKPAEKRKAKAKAGPAKKAKTKKEVVKATSSKATKQTEKKKKGESIKWQSFKSNEEQRSRILALISSSNALPFKMTSRNHFLCFYCRQTYLDFSELVQHSLEHRITEKQTELVLKLSCKEGVKLNFPDFACKLCNVVAESYDELKGHLTSAHGKEFTENDGILPFQISSEGFKCALCPQNFNCYKLLSQHINSHLCNFVCEQCGVGFATLNRARTHASSHLHGAFKCELCDKKFSKTATLKDHVVSSHLKIYKHKCGHCAETFSHYRKKIYHLVAVHGVKVPEYRCTMCPKVFLHNGMLKCHVKNCHLKVTKYECEICNRKFTLKTQYEDHLICHTGEKKFQCVVCTKKYSRKRALVAHMRIHNNDKRYACQFCTSAFVHKCSLQSHINTKHKVESDSE